MARSRELIFDPSVVLWVEERLNLRFEKAAGIGVALDGQLVAGVVYSEYRPNVPAIDASIVSTDPAWASRSVLRAIFAYPFNQLGVERLSATTAKRNKTAREFLVRLGFQLEGIGRRAFPGGGDAAVYSILRNECRWIR